MRKYYSFFKWAGAIFVLSFFLFLINNTNARATGNIATPFQTSTSESSKDVLLTEADLPGFSQVLESEIAGYLALAERFTTGLAGAQTPITDISVYRSNNLFQSEYLLSFLAYPLSEKDALDFDALASNPRSILEALGASAQTSGNLYPSFILSDLGDLGEKSMGFSLALGQDPVSQNIEFYWARRGTIIESVWMIYPPRQLPSINLHQLGVLVDQRVDERFPGIVFRPSGLLVPEITTSIPTPLDISTQPGVIGTNLLLAALMMLPFALAAEVFTRLSAEEAGFLRNKFWLTRWLSKVPHNLEKFFAAVFKRRTAGGNILRVILITIFYGLAFSLLDRTWNPFTITGLVLFLNMTVAYGIVGIADDLMQWRVLKKWGAPAEINLRPNNIFIAAASTITSRVLSLVPGLMFGTPEALIIDEKQLGNTRRNYLLKVSALTLLSIGIGLWILTTITAVLQRQTISDNFRNAIGGLEGFLLIVFAVALENTFVQMLGLHGSFGEAVRKKSRVLWALGLTLVTFAFYHTLINPRGELSAAMQESNVRIFLGVAGAFVLFTLTIWASLKIRGRKSADLPPENAETPRKRKTIKLIPAWVWLAAVIIGGTVVGDILFTRHNQQIKTAGNPSPPGEIASIPTPLPIPVAQEPATVGMSFTAPVTLKRLCFVPAVNVAERMEDQYFWRSVQLAAAQVGAQPEYLDPETADDAGYARAFAQIIRDGCDLIIGNYSSQGQALMDVAAGNPDQNFMLLGGGSDLPNIWVTKYSLPEQAYLAGYIAAAASTSGRVGTFGDPQIPNVISSMNCFALGVRDYNKAQQANVIVLGWDGNTLQGLYSDGLLNPDKGIGLANGLISQGVDIVFPMAGSGAGSTGSAILTATEQHAGVYAIGVDLNWTWVMPEFAGGIVSSVETRFDRSIAIAVDALSKGEFNGGVHEGDLTSGEIGLSPLTTKFSEVISPQVNKQLIHQSSPEVITAEINSCEIHQAIGGFLNLNDVDGSDWPADTNLTIRVFSAPGGQLIFTGTTQTDAHGSFDRHTSADLVPGTEVEVDFGAETSSVFLVPLTIDNVDMVADTVSGTAPAGSKIDLNLGDIGTDIKGYLSVTASSDGHWQASFSGNYDINSQTVVQATVPDENGNGTVIKIAAK